MVTCVCGVYMLIWCVPWISVRGHVCVWCVHADMVCALDFSEGSRVCGVYMLIWCVPWISVRGHVCVVCTC